MSITEQLSTEAKRLAQILKSKNLKIVFAESCTGGLISATLTQIPGISSYHCGSAVVYQVETKAEWLGISRDLLDDPGPVSSEVAIEMVKGVLLKTPQADVAASVTGHLGPNAPENQEGLIYVAVGVRESSQQKLFIKVKEKWLSEDEDENTPQQSEEHRLYRQRAAARFVLTSVCEVLNRNFD
jgi:nicotinamide-nucleotide amidase